MQWVIHTVVYTAGCLLQVEGEEHEQKYSHIFHLMPEGGSYWVQVRCITLRLERMLRTDSELVRRTRCSDCT